jgi:glycosyltransferase involved in cell wall biosynthesis
LTGSDLADLQREGRASRAHGPLVSLVVPTYNTARYLASLDDSVIAQTYEDREPSVLKDGSRGKTVRLVQQLAAVNPSIRTVEDTHGGLAVAHNQGLWHSHSRSISVISKRLLAHA